MQTRREFLSIAAGSVFLADATSLFEAENRLSGKVGSATVSDWNIVPYLMITQGDAPCQQFELFFNSSKAEPKWTLRVFHGNKMIVENPLENVVQGANAILTLIPETKETVESRWILLDGQGIQVAEKKMTRTPPRQWTLYLLSSSHVDIGLHQSQYKQRKMTVEFIDQVRALVDHTAEWPEDARYRYHIEGTWAWLNYPQDRSEVSALEFVEKYVKPGYVSIGASQAGNHTQVYGFEQLCRATYYKKEVFDRWGINRDTMVMVDNNGIVWSLVTPFVDAGIRNIIWLPNRWNPPTIGGSRVDVSFESDLPLLFYWIGPDQKSKMLLWAGDHYWSHDIYWGARSGYNGGSPIQLDVERSLSKRLALLEQKYPFDIWMISRYSDNEAPNLNNAEFVRQWNEKWLWPRFVTMGDISEPFARIREKFGDQIPILSGDITSGWAQHPVCTPELLAQKFEADSLLPTAEKLSTLARMLDPSYIYPVQAFRRAYDALLSNDEHSYGVSGYKGRDVYETWIQHRDWIDKAEETAQHESQRALDAIVAMIPRSGPSIVAFNPTLIPRTETIEVVLQNGTMTKVRTPKIPSFGYSVFDIPRDAVKSDQKKLTEPPVLENSFYRLKFEADGTLSSIFDKELDRELIDQKAGYQANQFVYTKDNHETFTSPKRASFELKTDIFGQTLLACIDDPVTQANIIQKITLPNDEKRIDIDNHFSHVHDLFNKNRYYRFGYYAFPFNVENFEFHAQLNGCIVRPKIDRTRHTTDSYTTAREWVSVGNGAFTIGLVQLDSHLVEFGKIHANKKEMDVPAVSSHIYSYIFTDWLQMHTNGGSAINPQFRYVIYSGQGDYQKIGLPQLAERATTPLLTKTLENRQTGNLPEKSHSFMSVAAENVRLLTLKASEQPGRGVIARFHEIAGKPVSAVKIHGVPDDAQFTVCSVTEEDKSLLKSSVIDLAPFGYLTIRTTLPSGILSKPLLSLQSKNDSMAIFAWTPVDGAVQYDIYRGECAEYQADVYHLLATTVEPKYHDRYLSPGNDYFYRVIAVDAQWNGGPASDLLSVTTDAEGDSPPAPIGSNITGLVTIPRTAHGDDPDHLYLEWGQNMESDLSHYELYRSEKQGFTPNESNFVQKVEPGPYRVVAFENKGLKEFTRYYYRVRAIDKDGNGSEFSEEFTGQTREPYQSKKLI